MEKITFSYVDIRNGVLKKFEEINPGALHVFLILVAHSKNRISKITTEKIRDLTDFSPHKINECLNGLDDDKLIQKLGETYNRKYKIL